MPLKLCLPSKADERQSNNNGAMEFCGTNKPIAKDCNEEENHVGDTLNKYEEDILLEKHDDTPDTETQQTNTNW